MAGSPCPYDGRSGETAKSYFLSSHVLVPIFLFAASFTLIMATIGDYGLTWDETCYIENAKTIERWFSLSAPVSSRFSYTGINATWNSQWRDDLNGNVHPPFIKLSAIAFRYLAGNIFFDNIVYQYRVSTAFWASLLVAMLCMLIRRFTGSLMWGVIGGLSFLAVPRFFAEAHFFTTDMVVSSLGFSGLAVFVCAARPQTRILLGGLVFGAALATKFTGIIAVVLVAALLPVAADRRRFAREYGLMLLVACFGFCLFNFPMLFSPQRELAIYFMSALSREKIIPITTLYFGVPYDFRLPLLQPWVMLGITLPVLLVITALTGIVAGGVDILRRRERFAWLALVPFLLFMVLFTLPTTPKHDGIRLMSSVWPFIILLVVHGCRRLPAVWGNPRTGFAVCSVSLVVSTAELWLSHPYQLSYYNQFIGGSKGAEASGFIISYWYDAFNQDFFDRVARATGAEVENMYSYPNPAIVLWNRQYGLYRGGLRAVRQQDDYRYVLVLNRILTPEMREYIGKCTPVVRLTTRDGAFIGGLFWNE